MFIRLQQANWLYFEWLGLSGINSRKELMKCFPFKPLGKKHVRGETDFMAKGKPMVVLALSKR
jgi:hypothetical protein